MNTTMYKVAITAVGMKAAARAAKDDGPGDLMPEYVSEDTLGKVGCKPGTYRQRADVVMAAGHEHRLVIHLGWLMLNSRRSAMPHC